MKRILAILVVMLFFSGCTLKFLSAADKVSTEITTEIEQYQAHLQELIRLRQEYVQNIQLEIIKTQAVIEYLKENEKKKAKKK